MATFNLLKFKKYNIKIIYYEILTDDCSSTITIWDDGFNIVDRIEDNISSNKNVKFCDIIRVHRVQYDYYIKNKNRHPYYFFLIYCTTLESLDKIYIKISTKNREDCEEIHNMIHEGFNREDSDEYGLFGSSCSILCSIQ